MFQCDDGYSPTEVVSITCTSDGSWLPNLTETTCSMMINKGTLLSFIGDWHNILNLITIYVSLYT